jgi:oligopeptide/dipeptide ABC transporter ATP-binding protein
VSLLEIDNLAVRYGDKAVVDGVTASIAAGESVGLVGESGSGKSQTALAVLGLLPATAEVSGSIRFAGQELQGADEAALDELRATKIAMVFQDPMQALNPYLSIGAQLSHILVHHGIADGGAARERVIEMLERVGLPDAPRQFRAYPHELSGGMRQRAMIASALLCGPDLLIADEPTTALDVTVQAQILDLLEALRQDTALLLITHDLGVVAGRCERMLVLDNGRLVEEGATRDVFATPASEHARALLEAARIDRDITLEPAGPKTCLEVRDARVEYTTGGGQRLPAVRGVDLHLRHGENLAIVGESGSGKSSLARGLLGLVPLQDGRVEFGGVELPRRLEDRPRDMRTSLQLVFQDPAASLNPQMRVGELVAEPLGIHKKLPDRRARRERAAMMLEKVGLGGDILERFPHELSGGQAQRVAIARALILEPQMLICDEAVAALDGTVREQILDLLREQQAERRFTIIFITHDLAVAREISHQVVVMYLGGAVEQAATAELFARPRHPYTRALLGAVPIPDPESPGGRASVSGEVPSALSPPAGCAFHPRCPHAQPRCATEPPELREVGGSFVRCHFAEDLV